MIHTNEGRVDLKGLTIEVMADISVIIQTLRKHKLMSDDLIMQSVINGFNDIEAISQEEQDEVDRFLEQEREKVKGGEE